MKRYQVTLRGTSPLLFHAMEPEWTDSIKKYRNDPLNKKKGVAGDDRSPAWSWVGYAYHDGRVMGIPSDNLMTCIRDGATMVTASGKKTFKAQSQSGILVNEILWPVTTTKGEVPWGTFEGLIGEEDFQKHTEAAKDAGFELFLKPAKVGQGKHIRVRPRFDTWSATGTITVFDDMITKEVLESILMMSGSYCGIGDWRPKSPRAPGPFGRFEAKVKVIK